MNLYVPRSLGFYVLTQSILLFDRKYYFDTYGLEDSTDDLDAGSHSDRDCVGVGPVSENEWLSQNNIYHHLLKFLEKLF